MCGDTDGMPSAARGRIWVQNLVCSRHPDPITNRAELDIKQPVHSTALLMLMSNRRKEVAQLEID